MTMLERVQREPGKSKGLVALIVATLGTVAIVVYYLLGSRELQGMDVAMLFVVVVFTAYGTMVSTLRGLLTAVSAYFSTAVATMIYPVFTPYARTFLNLLPRIGIGVRPPGAVDTSALAVSFAAVTAVLWVVLELLFRAALEDAHLAFLGFLDRVGGMLTYLMVGVAVASLLFTVIGYGAAGRAPHDNASLRPEFNQVMELIYRGQAIWRPGRPPAIYVYDLTPRE